MSQSINSFLKHWIDKQAGLSSVVDLAKKLGPKVGPFIERSPHHLLHAGKIGLGVGALGMTGEMGVKSVNNWMHGNPDLGQPTYTEKQVGTLSNAMATPVRSFLANGAQAAADGLDASPNTQKIIDAVSNITNPAVRHQLLNDSLGALNTGAGAIAENVGNAAGNTVGRSLGHGLANGIWDDIAQHPLMTLGGAGLFGAGPAVAYDAVTYKRRKEEAERNKAIMRYILKQEKHAMTKVANLFSGMESILPERTGISDLIKKYIYRPTGAPKSAINDLLSNYKGETIPNKILDKTKQYPQTLINNTITRHPFITLTGTSAALGTAATKMQDFDPQNRYKKDFDTVPHTLETWANNVLTGPVSYVKALEQGALQNSGIKSKTFDKMQNIKYNLESGDPNPPVQLPNNPSYRPPHIGLSDQYVNHLKHDNLIGISPETNDNQSSWKDAIPYLGAAGLVGTPLPAYMMYRRYADKKLNKLEDDNSKLQQRTELANQKHKQQ